MKTPLFPLRPLVLVLALCLFTVTAVPRALAVPDAPLANALRISQVYGGGGNSGAPYTHDYIEIFNGGSSPVSLNGLSLQYASATGTGNFGASATQLTELPDVLLQPGQYYLVQEAGGTTGSPLPTPDLVDATPINLSGSSGKVALVTGTTSLGCNGGSTPCDADQIARIVDLVGFGTANFFEGAGAAPTLTNSTAALRAGNGCTDTDDNAADFTADVPAPRNSSSPINLCTPSDPKINEFVFNHVSTDDKEYVEIFGATNTDYAAFAILQIEGDSPSSGIVDSIHTVGTTDANGFWFTG
ncbi:lamin tail domain-containing protein, partial [Arthrospira platensis SPKY1]|nr:lamin tail domain-containing protein [Arthrospira platensis SPKY1]